MRKTNLTLQVRPHRFRGRGGLDRLADLLQNQYVIGGDIALAKKIAKLVDVQNHKKNTLLIQQGDDDTDLYFILSGEFQIEVNGHVIATRGPGRHIGEMSLLEPLAKRSGTARALDGGVTARISEVDFADLAEQHSTLWRRVALSMSERLRERGKFHRARNEHPAVFIGSSSESNEIAKFISERLRRAEFVPRLWSSGVFELSKTSIEDLTRETTECDFAVLVLTEDDVTFSRMKKKPSPRDNVIFELGLFMGALTRTRTFVLAPSQVDLKIPSDLLGVTFLRYARRGGSIGQRMSEPLKALRKHMRKYGPREVLGAP